MNTTTFFLKGAYVATLKHAFSFLLIMGTLILQTQAQTVIYSETFDAANQPAGSLVPSGWTVQNLADSGPGPTPNDTLWRFTPDGTASNGAYWNNRPSIQSPSGASGAIVFDSDFLDNAGIPGASCAAGVSVISCAPHEGVITSPDFDASNFNSVTLKFYQYFRGFDCRTFVEVSNDGGNNWTTFQVNQDITDLPFGGESDLFDPQILNISSVAAGQSNVQIRFRFEGEYYFWIIDDIFVLDAVAEDLSMEEIVWPNTELNCYLGKEEFPKVRVKNLGQTAQSSFSVRFISSLASGQTDTITEIFTGQLEPNETALVTFSTPLDLRGLGFYQSSVSGTNDSNPDNNSQGNEINFPCEICTDSTGREYVCDQVVLRYVPGTDSLQKKELRETYNAERVDFCGCDSLFIWRVSLPDTINGTPVFTPEAISNLLGGETDIEESGLNHMLDLKEQDLSSLAIGFRGPEPSSSPDTLTVAILDTGLDFKHDSIKQRFWVNQLERADPHAIDPDSNCYENDYWGGNMIDPNLLPIDDSDSGHGTHVSGTVLNGAPACIYTEVMPVKVVASNGRGSLFDMVCGMSYAREKGADIVNASLGYKGELDSVLFNAIHRLDTAGILLITSAGNDSSNNDQEPHWPSNFTEKFDNVIAVTSLNKDDSLSRFANFGLQTIDLATKGEFVEGPVNGPGTADLDFKSGTSMATALVSRVASFFWAQNPTLTHLDVKNHLMSNAVEAPLTVGLIPNNSKLNESESVYLSPPCVVSVSPDILSAFSSYPNPFDRELWVKFTNHQANQFEIRVFQANGQLIHVDKQQYPAGEAVWKWDAPELPQGLYIYQIFLNGRHSQSGKWIRQ